MANGGNVKDPFAPLHPSLALDEITMINFCVITFSLLVFPTRLHVSSGAARGRDLRQSVVWLVAVHTICCALLLGCLCMSLPGLQEALTGVSST